MLERNVCEGQWPTPNDTKVIKGCLGTVFLDHPVHAYDMTGIMVDIKSVQYLIKT